LNPLLTSGKDFKVFFIPKVKIENSISMPSNELFSLEILVNEQPLSEYIPEEDDYNYTPQRDLAESDFDRVCYVEASPGSIFKARIKYLGNTPLTHECGYSLRLFVDGSRVDGKGFHHHNHKSVIIDAKRIAGGMEQAFVSFLSN
jgi:hypothetical protein